MKPFLTLVITGTFLLAGVSSGWPAEEVSKKPEVHEKATFAGGCFWCVESFFDKTPGVISTTSGYTGGKINNPSYEQVSSGQSGHTEAVELVFDPSQVSYAKLLDTFWKNIDPTQKDGQFQDRGTQYRTAVFYHSEEQKRQAEAYKTKLEESGKYAEPIVTEIVPAADFYPAEDYHQNYHQKNPLAYKLYSMASGREEYVRKNKPEE